MILADKNKDTLFAGIDLTDSLKKLILMSLEDGILTDREKELIKRKALAEGIDEIEFDFYFEKIEERFNSFIKNDNSPTKALKAAFDSLKNIAEGGKGV